MLINKCVERLNEMNGAGSSRLTSITLQSGRKKIFFFSTVSQSKKVLGKDLVQLGEAPGAHPHGAGEVALPIGAQDGTDIPQKKADAVLSQPAPGRLRFLPRDSCSSCYLGFDCSSQASD